MATDRLNPSFPGNTAERDTASSQGRPKLIQEYSISMCWWTNILLNVCRQSRTGGDVVEIVRGVKDAVRVLEELIIWKEITSKFSSVIPEPWWVELFVTYCAACYRAEKDKDIVASLSVLTVLGKIWTQKQAFAVEGGIGSALWWQKKSLLLLRARKCLPRGRYVIWVFFFKIFVRG